MKLSTGFVARIGLAASFMLVAVSMAALVLVPRYSRPVAVADIGTAAPDFQLRDTTGHDFSLANFRGQAVVLYFSSLDSSLCAEYNDRVEQLARRYGQDSRVKFLAVNRCSGDAIDPLLVRLDERVTQRSYPTLIDIKGLVASRYSANTLPYVVVVDPRGYVCYRGPFDNNLDVAFVTHPFCAEAVHDVLATSDVAVASK